MIRRILPLAALLAATFAFAGQKVSTGGTPPADAKATQAAEEKAAAERNRREEARKALRALQGPAADKPGTGGGDNRR